MNLAKLNKSESEILARIEKLEKMGIESKFSLTNSVNLSCSEEFESEIIDIAMLLKPWRKGPFKINEILIDSEWQSFMKFNLLKPHLSDICGGVIADVGCNNGYYMFKMLEFAPKFIVGFDPSVRCFLQFRLINALAKTPLKYELLGVSDLPNYELKFDAIFCLGVIYHRSDPVAMLRQLKASLNVGGVVFLDSLYIDSPQDIALVPRRTYSKISNIHFVPSISALRNWCERAGFGDFTLIATQQTTPQEQRRTAWSEGFSLGDFLDPNDTNLTCEGYEAPKRVYVRLRG